MAKKDTFTQEKANAVIEAAAVAAYLKFGFNPTAILGFEVTEAGDIYVDPKLPGGKDWFYFKDPVGEEAFIFNFKTQEVLLVESEESWSEKAHKKLSKISKADIKLWNELTGGELLLGEAQGKGGAKKATKKKAGAKKAAKKAPKKTPKKAAKKAPKKASKKAGKKATKKKSKKV